MNRYFQSGAPMPKVGSVAHQLFGQGAQQYVKAEDFDRLVEERNALQASLDWRDEQYSALEVLAAVLTVAVVGLTIALFIIVRSIV